MAQYNNSSDLIERIRSGVDIYELVRQYVPELRQSGKNFKARCPFHNEKTASFVVSPDKGIFHCFGCGLGGDVFKFIMNMENLDFKQALVRLSEKAGIDISLYSSASAFRQNSESRLFYKILDDARDFYHKTLLSATGSKARLYLESRGIKAETVKKFQIGYAPQTSGVFVDWAVKRGYSAENLSKLGLAAFDQNKSRYRDYFWNRIMFPIIDNQGRTCGFGARVLDKGEPKFLNSPDSPVFSKGRILYGLYNGSAVLRETKTAVLLEGYFDVITSHQEGAGNTVASLGTALTADQAKLLKRYVEYAVIAYDPDKAGRSASLRSSDVLLENGFYPKIAVLPDGLDADDFILKHGADKFHELIANSKEAVRFKVDFFLESVKPRTVGDLSIAEKVNFAKSIIGSLGKNADTIYNSECLKVLSEALDIDERALAEQARKAADTQTIITADAGAGSGKILSLEEEIINLTLAKPKYALEYGLKKEDFKEEFSAKIFDVIIKTAQELGFEKDACSDVLAKLEQPEADWITENMLSQDETQLDRDDLMKRLVLEMKKSRLREKEKALSEKVNRMLNKQEPRDEKIFEEYKDITRILKGVNSLLDIETANKYI